MTDQDTETISVSEAYRRMINGEELLGLAKRIEGARSTIEGSDKIVAYGGDLIALFKMRNVNYLVEAKKIANKHGVQQILDVLADVDLQFRYSA